MAKFREMVANLVAHLLRQLYLGSNPDISKNTKWVTKAKEWPTHSVPPKKYTKYILYITIILLLMPNFDTKVWQTETSCEILVELQKKAKHVYLSPIISKWEFCWSGIVSSFAVILQINILINNFKMIIYKNVSTFQFIL